MNNTHTIRKATRQWLDSFSQVPASVIKRFAEHDDRVLSYDSDAFRLLASPGAECGYCTLRHEGGATLADLTELNARGVGNSCAGCEENRGDGWIMAFPQYAFPCAWGTLFSPNDGCDQRWMREHADEVARLGFYVFDSEDWGIVLGIDAAGFDFFEAYWTPLYELRGLQWHATA